MAYGSLLQERRAPHACIVMALEALAGDRLDDQVERLAQHALRGEVWEKALAYGRQAGDKALTRSAYREAVVCFEQALAALEHLPASRAITEQAIDLRLGLRTVLTALREAPGRMGDHLRHAESLARQYQQRGQQVWALWLLGESTARQASPEGEPAVSHYRQALALAEELGMRSLQAHYHRGLGTLYARQGQQGQARAALATAIALYRDMEMPFWLPQAEAVLALVR